MNKKYHLDFPKHFIKALKNVKKTMQIAPSKSVSSIASPNITTSAINALKTAK